MEIDLNDYKTRSGNVEIDLNDYKTRRGQHFVRCSWIEDYPWTCMPVVQGSLKIVLVVTVCIRKCKVKLGKPPRPLSLPRPNIYIK